MVISTRKKKELQDKELELFGGAGCLTGGRKERLSDTRGYLSRQLEESSSTDALRKEHA